MYAASEYAREIDRRTQHFASVFAPDVIDAALAACDEALMAEDIPEGLNPERVRLYIKEQALVAVAKKFQTKADELEEQRWRIV